MFSGWQAFYQLTGGAAAQLIGLLFIVATLTRSQPQQGTSAGQQLFTTPTVAHLGIVLVVSALALSPALEHDSATVLMMAFSLGAFVYATWVAIRFREIRNPTDPSDVWFYGVAPPVVHLALSSAAACAVWRVPHAPYAVGLVLLALLILAIRNAWDLVTWLAPRRTEG